MKQIQIVFLLLAFLSSCCDKVEESPTECHLIRVFEPNEGEGIATIAKYYFDKNEKKCKFFIWKGDGGVIPFETLAECEACGCE